MYDDETYQFRALLKKNGLNYFVDGPSIEEAKRRFVGKYRRFMEHLSEVKILKRDFVNGVLVTIEV